MNYKQLAMDKKNQFDPFYSTSMCNGNSGLGLSIVHNIVTEIFKGRIELASTSGEGAHFILTLPLVLD